MVTVEINYYITYYMTLNIVNKIAFAMMLKIKVHLYTVVIDDDLVEPLRRTLLDLMKRLKNLRTIC